MAWVKSPSIHGFPRFWRYYAALLPVICAAVVAVSLSGSAPYLLLVALTNRVGPLRHQKTRGYIIVLGRSRSAYVGGNVSAFCIWSCPGLGPR